MTNNKPRAPLGSVEAVPLFVRALRLHWMLGLFVAGCVVASVVFYTIGQKRIYRASATVQIDPNPPRPLGNAVQTVVDMGSGSYWTNKEYHATQQAILKGRAIAAETVRVLNLHRDAAFLNNLPPNSALPKTPGDVTTEKATDVLRSRLTLEPVKDSRLVIVNIDDANPDRARRILSTLVDVYLARNVDIAVASTGAATEWLRAQTESLKTELEKSELALHEYKKEKRILSVTLDDQSNMLRGEMQQLNEALTRVQAKREELAARVNELDKVDPNEPTNLPTTELLTSTLLANLRQEYSQAKGARESLIGAGKGENHPEVEAAQGRLETTRSALVSEVKNIQGALRAELTAVTKETSGLSGLFERAKQRALDLNMLEIAVRRLERSKQNTEKLFGIVLERSKETDLTSMMRFNNITVTEPPLASQTPIKPRVPVNLAFGLVLGLAFGFAVVLTREWMNQGLRTPDDVDQLVGIPVLGLLPSLAGRASTSAYYSTYRRRSPPHGGPRVVGSPDLPPELVAHALPASNTAECARGIRTSLTLASPDKPYRVILVTSGSPSEGKTTVATTIAIAFAQTGQRTLLVDCDLRRARLHRVFKQANAAGVSSVLQDPDSLSSATATTTVPNLSLLPAGPYVPSPAELLQSDRFANLLRELEGRFDRVVIDSPPVLLVTDAAILASQVDATVLVLRSKLTKRDTARQVVRKLADLGTNVVGAVLNGIIEPKRRRGYYYGYYSRYYGSATKESDGSSQLSVGG